MNGETDKQVASLRALKAELITEINSVAQNFVKEHPDPLSALKDPEVLSMINKLNSLKVQLISFIDALEDYIKSEGIAIPGVLENMLIELEKLQKIILVLNTANDKDSLDIKFIRSKINGLVEKLLTKDTGLIDKLIAIVPPQIIQNIFLLVEITIGAPIASLATWSAKSFVAGGQNILAVLGRLGLTEDMVAAASTETPLQPMRDFFANTLEKLKSSEAAPILVKGKVQELKQQEVKDAKLALIDGFDIKVKDIVGGSKDVLGLAADITVQEKINNLNNLKQKINQFLYAVDDYLNQNGLGITQLIAVITKLAELKAAIKTLQPKSGEVMTKAAAAVQEGINKFINDLPKNVIENLITKLNDSYILSSAVFLMKRGVDLIAYASSLPGLIKNTFNNVFSSDLDTLLGNLNKTGLPESINKNNTKSSSEILNGYFSDTLNQMVNSDIKIKMSEITLQDLIDDPEIDDDLKVHLINLDKQLDHSENSKIIRTETITLILRVDPNIRKDVDRTGFEVSDKSVLIQEYKDKVTNVLENAGYVTKALQGIVAAVSGIVNYFANKISTGKLTSSFDAKAVKKTTEEIGARVQNTPTPRP
jgi:hypothetical protein